MENGIRISIKLNSEEGVVEKVSHFRFDRLVLELKVSNISVISQLLLATGDVLRVDGFVVIVLAPVKLSLFTHSLIVRVNLFLDILVQ